MFEAFFCITDVNPGFLDFHALLWGWSPPPPPNSSSGLASHAAAVVRNIVIKKIKKLLSF